MSRLIAILILVSLAFTASSQGNWNIGYIPIDSLQPSDTGRQVKIDFKHPGINTPPRQIRHFVEPKDTGQITLEGNSIDLIERRKIYVDHGSYKDQYLETPGYSDNRILRIYDSEILEVKNDSILFRLYLEIYTTRKNKIAGDPVRQTVTSRIGKNKLDGVMIKK